jgi:hypothetical protein
VLEVPANGIGRHNPWEHLQATTRLDGAKAAALSDEATVDALRHGAVWLTHMLGRARDGFARHCNVVRESTTTEPAEDRYRFLVVWIDTALRAVQETRVRLVDPVASDTGHVVRERSLIDEFTSVSVLEMLGHATSAAASLAPSVSGAEQVRERTAKAVADEFEYRKRKGFPVAAASSEESVEGYVVRAATLKKHFEEVLFLDRETNQVDERVQQWVVTLVAMLAGVCVFLFLGLIREHLSAPSKVGTGLLLLAIVAEVAYATRERVKDFARSWIAGKLYRFHAQRISRYRVPEERPSERGEILRAREWCTLATRSRPDPLNPEAGASLQTTRVHYLHKGTIWHDDVLSRAGVVRARHVFRYDFTPVLTRLKASPEPAPLQPVQVDDGVGFVEAPRRYYVPLSVRVSYDDASWETRATVVLDRRGLERVDAGVVEPDAA